MDQWLRESWVNQIMGSNMSVVVFGCIVYTVDQVSEFFTDCTPNFILAAMRVSQCEHRVRHGVRRLRLAGCAGSRAYCSSSSV